MKKTLRVLCLLVVVIMLYAFMMTTVSAIDIPEATSDFYVNDFAGVFTQDEKNKLMTEAVNLANEYNGVQVVVTTITSLEGDTVENYANKMYNQYGIGKDDMGILILIATEDRQIRVEVGRAMEGYINDAKAGRFIDKYAINYLKDNKFNEGLISLQQALITEIKSCIGDGADAAINDSNNINIDWGTVLWVIFAIVMTGGIAWLIFYLVTSIKKKKKEKADYIQGLKDEIATLKETINDFRSDKENLCEENKRLEVKLENTKQALTTIEERHRRILIVYPDADQKVEEMIRAEKVAKDIERAGRVNKLIASVIDLPPDQVLFSELQSIEHEISSLSPDELKHVVFDLRRFDDLYTKCYSLKKEYDRKQEEERIRRLTEKRKKEAANITKQLLGIIAIVGIARASDLSRLRDAKRLYESLDTETRSYVDSSAISQIEDLFRRAKRAKEDEEEQERRRRSSYNSTSSFGGRSGGFGGGFGGFGGRSGGGGASRGF